MSTVCKKIEDQDKIDFDDDDEIDLDDEETAQVRLFFFASLSVFLNSVSKRR
jgi:hypothetical protein